MVSSFIFIFSVHKKEKKFKCNYCGYTCAKQSDMKKHTRNVHKVTSESAALT